MSAVWRASRAAVRRRRLQTVVIGVVVFFSTATVAVALALLNASSGPFDAAFDQQRGAHAVAAFDPDKVSDAQLAGARPPVVEAVAGPFGQAILQVPAGGDAAITSRSLTVVGRADPGGPVDRVDVWAGRWANRPGEIVLNSVPAGGADPAAVLGSKITVAGRPTLTVVGRAYSVSQTADAWVSPEQISGLHPTATQMLYRFTASATSAQIETGMAAVTSGLPPGALFAKQSYLTVKQAVAGGPGAYVPFLVVFGVLGLVVAVLIVGNVVSGAVVSGFRHIGVLKALGFTPRQVVMVYVVMVLVPAVVGCVLGTVAGYVGAQPLLENSFKGLGFGGQVGVDLRLMLALLVGVPIVVILAALVPALRAYRLSAAEAISAGSAPRTGRGLRVQRWLGGTRLPRSVSLGLGLPFVRPGRTGLTLAAVLLGVTTVTFATGLASTVTKYADASDSNNAAPVAVRPGKPAFGQVASTLSDTQMEALLRSLPGTAHVMASLDVPLSVVGQTQSVTGTFLRGDATTGLSKQIVKGRWLQGPGEIVAPSQVLHQHGLAVGDRITLQLGDRQTTVTIVGETLSGGVGGGQFFADWRTLDAFAPDYQVVKDDVFYQVELTPGTDIPSYVQKAMAAASGLYAWDNRGTNSFTVTVVGLSSALSLMLGIVAALGVFNTVVLNVRERRRDLGMLKSIGMTPRQVVIMMVTSMAALGVIGGLLGVPVGILAHHLIVPIAARAAEVNAPGFLLDVWHLQVLGLLALAGVAIAAIGALIPARSAARLVIAEVLHNE
jgi:ABC-type lipoprotein release transport system permease subunit